MKVLLVLTILATGLSGCTAIPKVQINSEDAKITNSFDVTPDKSVVYLYRDRNSHFGLFVLDISIGKDDVETYPSCFVRIELDPGIYHFEADHIDVFGFEDELDFNAKAGELSFFEYKPISRFIIPDSTNIIPKTKDEAISLIHSQKLCANPTVTLPNH
jgi:hypothetical protein